jgi:hypothetical protein
LSQYEPWGDRRELFPRFDAKPAGLKLGIVPCYSSLTISVSLEPVGIAFLKSPTRYRNFRCL